MSDQSTLPAGLTHGATRLPSVIVESYNVEVQDEDGFVGDRANEGAFRDLLAKWRDVMSKGATTPSATRTPTRSPKSTSKNCWWTVSLKPPASCTAPSRFLRRNSHLSSGAISSSRPGAIPSGSWSGAAFARAASASLRSGRTGVILKSEEIEIDLLPIRNDPDEAGLIGAAQLVPTWMFAGHDAILAVDIGGTNIRAGVVDLNLKRAKNLSKACVWKFDLWRHADEDT